MNRFRLVKHALLVSAGLVVFAWTLYFMATPLRFALGLTLSAITFVVGELLLRKTQNLGEPTTSTSSGISRSTLADYVIILALAISLVVMFFVPPVKEEIFTEWAFMPWLNIVRLIAAFSFNFLPGYLILAIVGKIQLSGLAKFVTSYLVSVFALTVTGFVSAYLVGTMNDLYLEALLVMCTLLTGAYFVKRLIHRRRSRENTPSASSLTEKRTFLPVVLVVLTILFMGLWLGGLYAQIGFFIGGPGSDMWRHHGFAQSFLDGKAFVWLHVPWWFHLYLASFIVMSGSPSANAYMALYPLIAMGVLAFYSMASAFFKDKRISSLATLSYAIFSGPSWIYALQLRNFTPASDYQAWIQIIYKVGDKFLYQGWYPPFVVGFNAAVIAYTCLWWLLFATWRLDLKSKSALLLMSMIVAISYWMHGVDPIIFVIYLAIVLLFSMATRNLDMKRRVRRSAIAILVALVFVTIIDLALTSQYDYANRTSLFPLASRYYYFNSPSFYAILLTSGAVIALTYGSFFERKLLKIGGLGRRVMSEKRLISARRRLAEALFYIYGVSIVVFVVLFQYLTVKDTAYGLIAWYIYPVVLGVPFLLGLVGLAIVLVKWNKVEEKTRQIIVILALTIACLFMFGQATSFVNEEFFYTGFWERRTINYMFPFAGVLMAYALVSTVNGLFKYKISDVASTRGKVSKIGAASILTSLLIISTVSSTLMAADFESQAFFNSSLTREELEALNFLHFSLPSGSRVAYLDKRSGTEYIRVFANDKWTYNPTQWWGYYSNAPSIIISSVRPLDIGYLYVNHVRDADDLKRNVFLQQLIKVLPVVYNNTEVTIYSIPYLRLPSPSSLGLVSLEDKGGIANEAYSLWSFSLMMRDSPYYVVTNTSASNELATLENLMITYDPFLFEEGIASLLQWASQGGNLIISNTNPYGFAADYFGSMSSEPLANCDSTSNWRTFYARGQISIDNSTKTEGSGSLRLQNNQSSWEEWIYTPSTLWNLTGFEYLGLSVYGTGGGPQCYLYLTDQNDNEAYYRYDLSIFDFDTREYDPSFIGWKQLLIPIQESFGTLNLSSVKKLRLVTGFQLPLDIRLDDIFVLRDSGFGRSMVSINGIQGSTNATLPNVQVENFGFSADSRIIANYTAGGTVAAPFALQKDFGNGTVTYLNINLLYQSIISERSLFTAPHEVLTKILEMVVTTSL